VGSFKAKVEVPGQDQKGIRQDQENGVRPGANNTTKIADAAKTQLRISKGRIVEVLWSESAGELSNAD